MRIFTHENGSLNWNLISGVCAIIGTALALLTYLFVPSKVPSQTANVNMVLNDYVAGDKIEGISLPDYEDALRRREKEIVKLLRDEDKLTTAEISKLQSTLERIDARQSDITASYRDVEALTREIRTHYARAEDPSTAKIALAKLFDGDTTAARETIKAGIPLNSFSTINQLTGVFQPVLTRTDFLKHVAGRDLENNNDYIMHIGRDGALVGSLFGTGHVDNMNGAWQWRAGQYCTEFQFNETHNPEKCMRIFATNTSVKFAENGGQTSIWAKK